MFCKVYINEMNKVMEESVARAAGKIFLAYIVHKRVLQSCQVKILVRMICHPLRMIGVMKMDDF